MTMRASVVIPTLNAARWLPSLLQALARQSPHPPDEVIIVDSGSTDDTLRLAAASPLVRLLHIERFTHGGARNLGIRAANGDCVVLMTQDAEPADPQWLSRLIAPLEDANVAGAYSRQIPRPNAPPEECFFLADRFPAGTEPVLRRHEGSAPPVYPATFFSNVSSAARRQTWMRFPFDESLLMSEDQHFAEAALSAGLALAYVPESLVIHSHSYTLAQTFRRYFDSLVAFRQLSRAHGAARSLQLGSSTLLAECAWLLRHHPAHIPYFCLYMAFKSGGVLAGHMAPHLPASLCAKFSLQPAWWTWHTAC